MNSSRLLVLIGGIVLIFGAAVPWGNLTGAISASEPVGINSFGLLTAVCGLVMVVIAAIQRGRPSFGFSLLVILVSVVAIGVLAFAFLVIFASAMQFAPGMVLTLVGTGWYISFIGAGLGLIGAAGPLFDMLSRPHVTGYVIQKPDATQTGATTDASDASILQHDVRRFCQMMWPQPDVRYWSYGEERYAAAAEYLLRNGMISRSVNGYAWRYHREQVTRWLAGQ